MATSAPEAEAASRTRRTPVLWSGRWPAVCGPPRVLPQRLCASACPRSFLVLWHTLSPVQTNFLSSAESRNQEALQFHEVSFVNPRSYSSSHCCSIQEFFPCAHIFESFPHFLLYNFHCLWFYVDFLNPLRFDLSTRR